MSATDAQFCPLKKKVDAEIKKIHILTMSVYIKKIYIISTKMAIT